MNHVDLPAEIRPPIRDSICHQRTSGTGHHREQNPTDNLFHSFVALGLRKSLFQETFTGSPRLAAVPSAELLVAVAPRIGERLLAGRHPTVAIRLDTPANKGIASN